MADGIRGVGRSRCRGEPGHRRCGRGGATVLVRRRGGAGGNPGRAAGGCRAVSGRAGLRLLVHDAAAAGLEPHAAPAGVRVLRAARVGDGAPGPRGRTASRGPAAAPDPGRDRCGRRAGEPDLLAPGRVPLLHPVGRAAQLHGADPCDAGRQRQPGLPARGDGPVQVGDEARAPRALRPGPRLLRARPRHAGAGHGGEPVRRAAAGLRGGADRDPARQGGVRAAPAGAGRRGRRAA